MASPLGMFEIQLVVGDLAAMTAFYRDRLGLEVSLEDAYDLRVDRSAFGPRTLPQPLVELVAKTEMERSHLAMVSGRYQMWHLALPLHP